MKTVTITRLKDELSALLDLVRAGHNIIVLDRNKPIAQISAVHKGGESGQDAKLLRLERAGLIKRAKRHGKRSLLAEPPPKLPAGISIVEALLEERRESR